MLRCHPHTQDRRKFEISGARILVTGASGFLGANLCLEWRNAGPLAIAALYRRNRPCFTGIPVIQHDLSSDGALPGELREFHPDWIVHCAAATDVDACELHPDRAWADNVRASANAAHIAQELGSRFLYISTDAVFDGSRGGYAERDMPNPLNVYATTKLEGERAVRDIVPDCLIVRTNIFGWNAHSKRNLAEWILSRLEHGERVPAFADVTFAPILVNDLADILLQMMDRQLNGIYHVNGAEAVSKYEFALKIADGFCYPATLVTRSCLAAAELKAARPMHTALATQKVTAALQLPMPSLSSGIQRMRRLRESTFLRSLKQVGAEELVCSV